MNSDVAALREVHAARTVLFAWSTIQKRFACDFALPGKIGGILGMNRLIGSPTGRKMMYNDIFAPRTVYKPIAPEQQVLTACGPGRSWICLIITSLV